MKSLSFAAVIVALVALFIAANKSAKESVSASQRVIDSGTIRLGYIIYPPLLYKDQSTGKLSGISFDIVEAAAKGLGLKTEWAEEVGWGTALEGLKAGRYDMLGTQMWPNSARAREAVFSIAPFKSMIFPYVRVSDNRFDTGLEGLNSKDVTISAIDGEMATFIAKEDFPKANLRALPQLASYSEVFLNIAGNKADVTFVEPGAAYDFMRGNSNQIKRVGSAPLRAFGNCFAFRRGEDSMVAMWDVALRELINSGEVARILKANSAAEYYGAP